MKIICIGRNYVAHAKELNSDVPTEPVIFLKPDTAQIKGKQIFYLPDFSNDIHHELEIVVKISKEGKHIDEKFAHKYYEEVSVGIDFTARDLQTKLKNKGLPWELSKAFDHSAPVGRFIPKSSLDLNKTEFSLTINDSVVQKGNTSNMLFKIDFIVAYVSTYFSLRKGDLIFTGTPEGVGQVKAGDVLRGSIGDEKLLELKIA